MKKYSFAAAVLLCALLLTSCSNSGDVQSSAPDEPSQSVAPVFDLDEYEEHIDEEVETRSIPDPTLRQEVLVPDNSFAPAPAEIFSTTAEENGLGDSAFYVEGNIVSRFDVKGYDTIQVATAEGDLYVSAVFVSMPEVFEDDSIAVFFAYTGWSDALNGPCGAYVYSEAPTEPVILASPSVTQPEPEPEPTSTPTPEPAESQETVTMGQKNALAKAKQYLSIMAFSYSGLIGQLEYEGYTTEEATYGADNCGADWNEQAAKKAQSYIDLMSFSRQRLIDQLKYDGFTQSQAEYGVSAVGY